MLVAPVQALRLLQTARLYRLVSQLFLVPPKPQTGRPQPLAQLFPVQRWHQLEFPDTQVVERLVLVPQWHLIEYLYILVFRLSLALRPLPLEFPDTQAMEQLARVQRRLLLGCLYILVFQLSLGLQPLPLARLYILVMEPASQALLLLQTEVLHLQLLPS